MLPREIQKKEGVICLFVDTNNSSQLERSRTEELAWNINFGALSHMTSAQNAFKTLKQGAPFPV